ncbi:hypothetical protein HK100_001158 [Physocladia obscura]|uniref:Major facilitator superfamily (MFS) profile domain-containing protein n=1 Tax=Physocladia obscura TaxID=109957 RepID=A0AAD5T7P6_9FUNG|nr:hypothetical protein HK100_001158 [Physocladia obscura]
MATGANKKDDVLPSAETRLNTNFAVDLERNLAVEDDVDAAAALSARLESGAKITAGNPNSTNPHEWPRSKKWLVVAIASLYTFISPISSSMVAPALPAMAIDLGMTKIIDLEMTLSIFVLAYAFGPLFLAPLSEVYGRYIVLQASLWFFTIFNLVCGFAQNRSQILLFRFLAGLGGSAPLTISGSVIADLFKVSEMGAAMAYYALGVILAPALGPIIGGALTQNATWHWVFYTVSIISAVLAIVGSFLLKETFRPLLESRARKEAAKKDPSLVLAHPEPNVAHLLSTAIMRPFIMLGTQPIAQVIALLMAFVYGIMYIVLTTYSSLFVEQYGESTFTSTLHYLALLIGFLIGNRMSGSLIDVSSAYLQKRYNTPHKPEYRLPVCFAASIFLPVGLFLYGWAAEHNWHWALVDFGIVLFSWSVNVTFQTLTVYTVDVYTMYSASALAAVGFLRSLAGFGFPLFAADMYSKYGYGWANSILAFVGLVIGVPAPILLYAYGEKIRAKSQFASG